MDDNKFMGDIGEAIKYGWYTTKLNIWFFVGVMLVIIVVFTTLGAAMDKMYKLQSYIGILSYVIFILFIMGLNRIFINFVDNLKEPEISDLFSCIHLFFSFLAATILYCLIVMVGLALFIIPGIIWAIRFSFYGLLIIDEELGPIEALRESAELTEGSMWDLLGFYFVFGCINMLGSLTFGLGTIVTIPTIGIAKAYVYRNLLSEARGPGIMNATPEGHMLSERKTPQNY